MRYMPILKMSIDDLLMNQLQEKKNKHHFQDLKVMDNQIDFASNDYLGFAQDQELYEKIVSEWQQHPKFGKKLGSTGTRLLTGNHSYFEQLEDRIASFHQAEAGVIFNSGYMANFGLFSSLLKPEHSLLYDLHIHASTHDGARASKAKCYPLKHNDLDHLESRLKQAPGIVFVAVESIYSTDGSIAPLHDIAALCEKYQAHLIVDEAHATGIMGDQGEGLVCKYGLQSKVYARLFTFSKALGIQGAIIAGSHILKQYLINFTRPFMYSTALAYPSLVAIKCAYEHLKQAQDKRVRLHQLIQTFKQLAAKTNIPFILNDTPIQNLTVPGNQEVQQVSYYLHKQGIDAPAITSPTAKRGQECLRISLHAYNTKDEIQLLLHHLSQVYVNGELRLI